MTDGAHPYTENDRDREFRRTFEYLARFAACRDGAGGGVAYEALADAEGITPDAARTRCLRLYRLGHAVQVNGIGPEQPRTTYLPVDHPDASGKGEKEQGGVRLAGGNP
jgi:hypothetical protein